MSRCSQTDLADFLVVMILDRKITIVNKLFDMFTFFHTMGLPAACSSGASSGRRAGIRNVQPIQSLRGGR